jgi:hypothetical protein
MKAGIKEFIAGNVTFTEMSKTYLGGLVWALRRLKHWWIWTVLGLFAGVISAFFMPQQYTASITMGIEEEKVGGFEALMAQFGLDAGGLNPGGVFEGESLITLFNTRNIIEKTLESKTIKGKDSVVFADELWKTTKYVNEPCFKDLNFNDKKYFNTKLRDSALYLLFLYSKKSVLNISKPDKKQAFIVIQCKHANAEIAHKYCELIVDKLSSYYLEVITSKARNNLRILKHEADSLKQTLQQNFHQSASLGDMNVNPLRQVMKVEQSRSMVDLQISISMYGEIAKQMKLAEISLRKQTPLVQVVDYPKYPFEKTGLPFFIYWVAGCLIGSVLGIVFQWLRYGKDSA